MEGRIAGHVVVELRDIDNVDVVRIGVSMPPSLNLTKSTCKAL